MYEIKTTSIFKKDVKKMQKRGQNMEILKDVIKKLEKGVSLQAKYRDHSLSGNWSGYRECHVKPDWLLIYRFADNFLVLERTGSHSDLFK